MGTTALHSRGYDSVRMVQQLVRMLNGPGGHVEQTYSLSGAPKCYPYFVALVTTRPYTARFRAVFPFPEVVQRVKRGREYPLKVIALGPGDGHLEVRFVNHLLGELEQPDIELVLFDISQPPY